VARATPYPQCHQIAILFLHDNLFGHGLAALSHVSSKVGSSSVSLSDVFINEPQANRAPVRALSEADAVEIWIARWLRIRRKDLVVRFGCDPRRLYEVWEGRKHPASRDKALVRFRAEHPGLMDRVDFGPHRRIRRAIEDPDQLALFDDQ